LPKKTRREKRKTGSYNRVKTPVSKVAAQSLQPRPVQLEKTRITQTRVNITQGVDRERQPGIEIKRISIIGGILLIILVILSMLLR
jgi:hypothetical protein